MTYLTLRGALRSKTVWFAILIAVLSVAQGYIGLLPLTPLRQMALGIAIAVAITLLRVVTTQSLAEK